jgi:hypothetical protein
MSNHGDGRSELPGPAPGNPAHHGFVSMFIFWPPFSLGLSSTDFLHPTSRCDISSLRGAFISRLAGLPLRPDAGRVWQPCATE